MLPSNNAPNAGYDDKRRNPIAEGKETHTAGGRQKGKRRPLTCCQNSANYDDVAVAPLLVRKKRRIRLVPGWN